jgi:hypothetical protein
MPPPALWHTRREPAGQGRAGGARIGRVSRKCVGVSHTRRRPQRLRASTPRLLRAPRTPRPGQGLATKNASGCRICTGDRSASGPRRNGCSEHLCLPPPLRNAHPPDLPRHPARSAGRRRHGFPRSHGPSKREVNGPLVKASLPRRPQPGPARRDMDRLPPAHCASPKCRRNPRAAGIRAFPRRRRAARPASVAARALRDAAMPKEPESRRDPGILAQEEGTAARLSRLAPGALSPRFGARSPRARPCTSPLPSDSGCSRRWDSGLRPPRPAAA